MKRVVNGKTYDTAGAMMIGFWTCEDRNEETREEDTLYKTRKAVFFIHHHEERQVRNDDGDWTTQANDSFQPLTRGQAQNWMGNGDIEILSDEFNFPEAEGEVSKD